MSRPGSTSKAEIQERINHAVPKARRLRGHVGDALGDLGFFSSGRTLSEGIGRRPGLVHKKRKERRGKNRKQKK
jgi:hypothetical protein